MRRDGYNTPLGKSIWYLLPASQMKCSHFSCDEVATLHLYHWQLVGMRLILLKIYPAIPWPLFCSYRNSNKAVATKFCTCHNSTAVVACAKIWSSLNFSNGIIAKWMYHLTWIMMNFFSDMWTLEGVLFPAGWCALSYVSTSIQKAMRGSQFCQANTKPSQTCSTGSGTHWTNRPPSCDGIIDFRFISGFSL